MRQQVIPYVDNDIRNDWVTAMRSASDGVETSYAMVVDKMTAVPTARFEFPGDLGTGVVPVQLTPPVATTPVPPVDPAPTLAAAVPGPISATTDFATPAPPPVAAAPPADWGAALGDALGMPAGDLGGLPMAGSAAGSAVVASVVDSAGAAGVFSGWPAGSSTRWAG